jgi:lipopolysaccharide export LptBFGC system permease protein LptF
MTFKNLLLGSILFLVLMMVIPQTSYSQDGTQWRDYSSQGNPKAKGHNFTLKYPSYYVQSTDFENEFVQVFNMEESEEESGDSFFYLTASIKNLPNNTNQSALKTNGVWDLSLLNQFWTNIANGIPDVRAIDQSIDWYNIPMARFSTYKESDGVFFMSAILLALHGDKLVQLNYHYNTFIGEGATTYLTEDETCKTFFNSLIFIDKP